MVASCTASGTSFLYGATGDTPIVGSWQLPEVNVAIDGGEEIYSGQQTIDFGIVDQGAASPQLSLRSRNDGSAPLLLGNLQIPDGFRVTDGMRSEIAPGKTDVLRIEMIASEAGKKDGVIRFTTNDSNETLFRIGIKGEVQPAVETVTLVAEYGVDNGTGFFDPTLGAARRNAFEYALGIWSELIVASYEGETITVAAGWDSNSLPPSALAGAGALYRGLETSDTQVTAYVDALANHLVGQDLDPAAPEIFVTFNLDVDESSRFANRRYYYGTDEMPGDGYDFVSVAVHEIGHGLNYKESVLQDGSFPDFRGLQVVSIYDAMVEDRSGVETFNGQGTSIA